MLVISDMAKRCDEIIKAEINLAGVESAIDSLKQERDKKIEEIEKEYQEELNKLNAVTQKLREELHKLHK